MRLRIDAEQLARGLATVSRAVPSRTPMPVLTAILLRADATDLTLTATDLELGVLCRVPATVDEPGAIALPARYLTEIVRRIPSGPMSWSVGQDRAVAEIGWQRSQFTIQGFSADQYPPFPDMHQAGTPVDRQALAAALRQTVFSASIDAARPILTGVELFVDGANFRSLATDGTRVAFYRDPPERDDWSEAQRLLAPARGLQEVLRLLEGSGDATLAVQDNQLLVDLNTARVAIRLLDGRYPAVLDLLPAQYPTVVRTDRAALHDACERVSLIADRPDLLYAMTISVVADGLELAARSPDVGEARDQIAAQVEGPELRIGLNARLLLDGLRHLGGSEVVLELSGKESALRLRNPDDGKFVYMQMPVRID